MCVDGRFSKIQSQICTSYTLTYVKNTITPLPHPVRAHCHLHCCVNLPYYKHITTRLPFLDLHHVSLIQDNLQNVPPAPQTSRITIFYKPTGAAIPPIPPNLVEKIESGAFVEMRDLLPSCLGIDNAAKSTQKHGHITNIMEWLQSFAVYVSVIARKQPQRVPDLMGYQVLILEASSEYKNDCWMAYDRRFRQDATSQPQRT